MKIPVSNYQALPADVYPVTLTEVMEKDSDFGPAVLLTFTVSSGDCAGATITGMASAALSRKSKLRGWVEGMMGKPFPDGTTEFDLDRLIGKPCRLSVKVVTVKDGMEVNRIDSVLPIRPAKPAPKVVEPEAETDGDDPF